MARCQLTTAEPMATPPAVAAICWNMDGCEGAAIVGDTALGAAAGATADGGGAGLAAGGGEGRAAGAVDICL